MSEIARSGKWNPGGGRWLEIVPCSAVAAYTRPASAIAPATITLKPGFSWTRIYCTPGTIGYKEKPDRNDNGRIYEFDIIGFSPDDSPAKRQALENLFLPEGILCRFCDNQGLIRVAGTPDQFLTFTFDLETDTDVPGKRGYSLQLSGTTTQPAAYE